MIPELEKLTDDELRQVGARAEELLKQRDTDRKAKAMAEARKIREKAEADARALLAAVGLGPKAAAPKKRRGTVRRRGKPEATPTKGKAA